MKKIFIISSFLFVFLSACESNQKQAQIQDSIQNEALDALKQEVIYANKQLPISIGPYRMQSMDISGNYYTVYIAVDENQIDLDEYADEMIKDRTNVIALVSGNHKDFAALLVQSGLNLKLVISGSQSNRQRIVCLTADEIKRCVESDYDAKDYLVEMVEEINQGLPDDQGDGLFLTSLDIEGNYLVYRMLTDESVYTMDLLKKGNAKGHDIEISILEEFAAATDPSEQMFFKYLKECGMGIKYVYWTKHSNDSAVINLSPAKIEMAIKDKPLY